MRSDRRDFLKAAALSAVALGGTPAIARGTSPRLIAIGTGLETDAAFAAGAAAAPMTASLHSGAGYGLLVDAMRAARGSMFIALVEPSQALLLEEAAMDCRLGLLARAAICAAPDGDRKAWAHSLGRVMALGSAPRQHLAANPSAGRALIALALR